MAAAIDVARYLLWLASHGEEPDCLTPMRLQKLLYYAQGTALGALGRPLFRGRIEAWTHGPVVREVWQHFQTYRDNIPSECGAVPESLSLGDRAFVGAVWEAYKDYAPSRLRAMTHAEAPWIEARGGLPEDAKSDAEITHESMRRFFAAQLQDRLIPGLPPEAAYTGLEELERGAARSHTEVFSRLRNRSHAL